MVDSSKKIAAFHHRSCLCGGCGVCGYSTGTVYTLPVPVRTVGDEVGDEVYCTVPATGTTSVLTLQSTVQYCCYGSILYNYRSIKVLYAYTSYEIRRTRYTPRSSYDV